MKKIKQILGDFNSASISSGLLGGIFGISTTLIMINTAAAGGLTRSETISWVFSSWFFSACIGLFLTLKYKTPLPAAWSIPGVAIVASGLTQYSLPELQGAYLVSGILLLLLGFTNIMPRLLNLLPTPIVMAMIAGTLLRFPMTILSNAQSEPLLIILTVLAFLLSTRFQRYIKLPPILISLLVSVLCTACLGKFDFSSLSGVTMILPQIRLPRFNLHAILSISIPLTIMVIGSENAQAVGVLRAQEYPIPVSAITTLSGIGSILASFFGAPNVNIAGPMTAICASETAGPKEKRYTAALINSLTLSLLGIFSFLIVPLAGTLPTAFITTVAGLAMVNIIISSLQTAFGQKKMLLGCFTSFLISLFNVPLLGIGAPFWAILGGILVSLITDPNELSRKA